MEWSEILYYRQNKQESQKTSMTLKDDDNPIYIDVKNKTFIFPPDFNFNIGTVGDHRTESVTFICPRYIEGYDILTCTHCLIKWENKGNNKSGYYIVKDMNIWSESDSDLLYFTWVLTGDVTEAEGTLDFSVSFINNSQKIIYSGIKTLPINSIRYDNVDYKNYDVIKLREEIRKNVNTTNKEISNIKSEIIILEKKDIIPDTANTKKEYTPYIFQAEETSFDINIKENITNNYYSTGILAKSYTSDSEEDSIYSLYFKDKIINLKIEVTKEFNNIPTLSINTPYNKNDVVKYGGAYYKIKNTVSAGIADINEAITATGDSSVLESIDEDQAKRILRDNKAPKIMKNLSINYKNLTYNYIDDDEFIPKVAYNVNKIVGAYIHDNSIYIDEVKYSGAGESDFIIIKDEIYTLDNNYSENGDIIKTKIVQFKKDSITENALTASDTFDIHITEIENKQSGVTVKEWKTGDETNNYYFYKYNNGIIQKYALSTLYSDPSKEKLNEPLATATPITINEEYSQPYEIMNKYDVDNYFGDISYRWNTIINSNCYISKGLNTAELDSNDLIGLDQTNLLYIDLNELDNTLDNVINAFN